MWDKIPQKQKETGQKSIKISDMIESIIQEKRSGISANKIAMKYNTSPSYIRTLIRKYLLVNEN